MRAKKFTQQNSEAGFVLAATMLLGLILTVTVSTGFLVNRTGYKAAGSTGESIIAFQSADSGIQFAKAALTTALSALQSAGTVEDLDSFIADAYSNDDVLTLNGFQYKNLKFGKTTVTLKLRNNASDINGDGSATDDTDRIVEVTSTATSTKNATVEIIAHLQAPAPAGNGGTVEFPSVGGVVGLCGGADEQTIRVKGGATIEGYNHSTLPDVAHCSGAACFTNCDNPDGRGNCTNGGTALKMLDSNIQTFNLASGGSIVGPNPTVQEYASTAACDDMKDFVDQVIQLSDQMSNTTVYTDAVMQDVSLGTVDNPKVSIITGGASNNVLIKKNVNGAGMLVIHSEAEAEEMTVAINKDFVYAGLIVIYGSEKTKLNIKKDGAIYGGIVVLTGNDPTAAAADKYKLQINKDTKIMQSGSAIRLARRTVGAALPTPSEDEGAEQEFFVAAWTENYQK